MKKVKSSWWCPYCKKLRKEEEDFCGKCGAWWGDCQTGTYYQQNSQKKQHEAPWNSGSQHSWEQWSQPWTPRAGRDASASRGRGKDKKDKKAKGKGKGKDKAERSAPKAEPKWNFQMPSIAAPPAPAQEQAATSSLDPAIKSLLTELKKQTDSLSPEIQTLMQSVNIKEGRSETSTMHKAVSEYGKARTHLDQVKLARYQLHTSWKNFLNDACQRWSAFTEEFKKQEVELQTQLQAATEALKMSKQKLDAFKQDQEAELIEDSEVEDMDAKSEKEPAAARLQEGLETMANSLTELKTVAENICAQENPNKRARTEDSKGGKGGLAAEQHFT